MNFKQCDLKFLFDNIKDGDSFGFFHKQPLAFFSKLISIMTHAKIDHAAKIYEVRRSGNIVSFWLSHEVMSPGGCYDQHFICLHEGTYYLHSFGNPYVPGAPLATSVFYAQLKKPLTPEQIQKGIADAKAQIGKPYGYSELFLTPPGILKIIPRFIRNHLLKGVAHEKRICSVHCLVNDMKTGAVTEQATKKIGFPSPVAYLTMDHLDLFQITSGPQTIACK